MVEIEWSVYSRTLPRFVPDDHTLSLEVQALTNERNFKQASVEWQFLNTYARIKLKQLYPSISE